MAYPEVVEARMIRRLAGPDAQSMTQVVAETGISQATLSRWLREAGKTMSESRRSSSPSSTGSRAAGPRRPQDVTGLERAKLVVEASTLSGEAHGSFLRKNGLHEAQIQAWTKALETPPGAAVPSTAKADAKRIKQLEKEIARKDKALAETAALLVLKKKAARYFREEEDDDIPNRSGR